MPRRERSLKPGAPVFAGVLTRRQSEVLVMLAQGLTFKDIAKALKVEPCTVRDHMQAMHCRLGSNNAAHAVHLAHQRGLIA